MRADILLLAETDELHGSPSGPATLALLKRNLGGLLGRAPSVWRN